MERHTGQNYFRIIYVKLLSRVYLIDILARLKYTRIKHHALRINRLLYFLHAILRNIPVIPVNIVRKR